MKVALLINEVTSDIDGNLASIITLVNQACDAGAKLVLLPETALTGLVNNDDPRHDLPLSQTIPGAYTQCLGEVCIKRNIWLATGLLERDGNRLYDAAVLLDPTGAVHLKYRRIQPQWHGRLADPHVYCQGSDLPVADTPWGRTAIIICGDLFDDAVVERVNTAGVQLLILPFARCFSDGTPNQMRWDQDEMPVYCERIARTGSTTLMANYLALPELMGGAFGGAFVVKGDGTVITRYSLGSTGMLLVDL